ncbi:MAG: FAD-dependent oxidoreductase [Actinocatenispora sp.]
MKAVICGAGIAGLALAHRLGTTGWQVVVLERAPGPRTQGYMIDFFGPGYDAAEQMGLLPRLTELGYPIEEASYLDESGRRRAGLSFRNFSRAMGGRLVSIMRPDLERALREQVPTTVDVRYGRGIASIDNAEHGVRVTASDGSQLDADLLVGADGIHSTVRRLVFGPEDDYLRHLGFHTAAFVIDAPDLRREIGDRFCLTDTVGRQVGCYGLRDGRVALFTVHRSTDRTLPDDARAAVREEYGSLGWIVPAALAACPEPREIYYDQVAQVELPDWNRHRVTLLGDSCQAVSLLAGQGASLAVAGAFVLADQLARATTVDEALAGYQELWRPVVIEKQQAARRGVEWFLPSSPTRLALRRTALRLMNLPGLDRVFGTALIGKSNATIRQLAGSSASPAGAPAAEPAAAPRVPAGPPEG